MITINEDEIEEYCRTCHHNLSFGDGICKLFKHNLDCPLLTIMQMKQEKQDEL